MQIIKTIDLAEKKGHAKLVVGKFSLLMEAEEQMFYPQSVCL